SFHSFMSILVLSFRDTATPELYTLSLHDALPIFPGVRAESLLQLGRLLGVQEADSLCEALNEDTPRDNESERLQNRVGSALHRRSEEHTSELQSRENLVCRLLLEKKK